MNIIQGLARNLSQNHPNQSGIVIDFSKMSIEDAIQLMMTLLSNDATQDMKDILQEMGSTRLTRMLQRGAINDLGNNAALANAVEDINNSIARNDLVFQQERDIAKADQRQAEALLAAAQQAEGNAGDLEHPVDTNKRNKNGLAVPIALSTVFIILIISGVTIKFASTPRQTPLPKNPQVLISPTFSGSDQLLMSHPTPSLPLPGLTINPSATVPAPITTSKPSISDQGVAKQNANCHFGPGTVFAVLSYIPMATTVTVTGLSEDGLWLFVKPCGLGSGWVLASSIEFPGNLSTLPVLIGPPTPTQVPPTPVPFFDCAAAYGSSSALCSSDPRCLYVGKTCVNR